jgi:hypothetical protein
MENSEDPFKIEPEKTHPSKKIAVAGIYIFLAVLLISIVFINSYKSSTTISLPKNTKTVFSNNSIQANSTNNSSTANRTTSCKNETVFINKTTSIFNNMPFSDFILPNRTYIINISQPNATQYLAINLSILSNRNITAGILTSGGLANATEKEPFDVKMFSTIYFGNINGNYSSTENISKLPVGENYVVFYNKNATLGAVVEIKHLGYTYLIKKQECVLAK